MSMHSPLAPHASTADELKQRLELFRQGRPFLVLRNADDEQVLYELPDDAPRLTIGRRAECDVHLEWDAKVSRLHAELERIGNQWTVSDDGLSHNGTFVGDERVRGQRRLHDGDLIAIGDTVVAFCDPTTGASVVTQTAEDRITAPDLSEADRRVLTALCRPLMASPYAAPASNAEIAEELFLSIAAIKSRLGSLFERFGLDELPQNQKRATLAATVLRAGIVGPDNSG